jgi:hypothetical protein
MRSHEEQLAELAEARQKYWNEYFAMSDSGEPEYSTSGDSEFDDREGPFTATAVV